MNFAEELKIISDRESKEHKEREITYSKELLRNAADAGKSKTIIGLSYPEHTIPVLSSLGLEVIVLPSAMVSYLDFGKTLVEVCW